METKYLIERADFSGIITSTVTNGLVDHSGYLHNNGGPDLSLDEYLKVRPMTDPAVLHWEELAPIIERQRRENYLDKPPVEITEEQYWDALEVLPPVNWCRGIFEHFRMSERVTGNITTQYGSFAGRYLMKYIDIADKSTWLKVEDFDK